MTRPIIATLAFLTVLSTCLFCVIDLSIEETDAVTWSGEEVTVDGITYSLTKGDYGSYCTYKAEVKSLDSDESLDNEEELDNSN